MALTPNRNLQDLIAASPLQRELADYFRKELALLALKLRSSEDSLTKFYVEKKVINYPEQTKIIAALSRDYDLLYNDAMLQYMSSKRIVEQLEEKIRS